MRIILLKAFFPKVYWVFTSSHQLPPQLRHVPDGKRGLLTLPVARAPARRYTCAHTQT